MKFNRNIHCHYSVTKIDTRSKFTMVAAAMLVNIVGLCGGIV